MPAADRQGLRHELIRLEPPILDVFAGAGPDVYPATDLLQGHQGAGG